ncbi:peptidoglycan-binding protein [Burkholderia ubonensis]|uniref:LysM peptidoglycan-binding domain-containing protein n=1 Tax=Burkholderia ubonensis TaxID=101571 RepID=UPI000754BCBF|nr:LysM domain-containing protein [Burkholderia ubonensis]KUZ90894.1 peptidoglycan-binding protein [Burkholderia ubonensis]
MATQTPHKTKFEKWQVGIDRAESDAKWNAWDCEIQIAVSEYNRHLSGTAGYKPLDWHLVKAMIWVETGAESDKWVSNPIQIGNPGDPGLNALLNGREGGELIVPPAWKEKLTIGAAITMPSHNIRAGIGYLLMRMANYSIKSVPDTDATVYEVTVRAGDSIYKIARDNGSTIESIRLLNPTVGVLRPGQVVKYRKAAMKKAIVGWKAVTTSSIAAYYNVGDPMYAKKLNYALTVIGTGEAAICPQ